MRLTNRGRVVVGLAATVVVVAVSRAFDPGGTASAGTRPVAGQRAATHAPTRPATARTSQAAAPKPTHTANRAHPARPLRPTSWVHAGDGTLTTVAGSSTRGGHATRLYRYRVQVEGGIRENPQAFADAVQRTLTDRRSWGRDFAFQRVDDTSHYDFTVVLVSPTLAEELCQPLEINYVLSCRSGGRSVINDMRWRHGADSYGADLASYRTYVVNHEVGHMLGHGHLQCAGAGSLAPVMMQQTKGVGACRPNPWVYPS